MRRVVSPGDMRSADCPTLVATRRRRSNDTMTLCETPSRHAESDTTHGQTPLLRTREASAGCTLAADSGGGARGDATTFLRSWLQHPLRTAAIAPSSPALARLMTRDICASDRVVELGPGTGVFTRALLARGVPPSHLTVVESNPAFADLLTTRFEGLQVVRANAATDPWQHSDHTDIDAVISGLPLLSMSAGEVSGVLSTAFTLLSSRGRFYQFTYGPKCPIRPKLLAAFQLKATRVGWTPRNLPPATVYRIERHLFAPIPQLASARDGRATRRRVSRRA